MNKNVLLTVVLCFFIFIAGFILGRLTAGTGDMNDAFTNVSESVGIPSNQDTNNSGDTNANVEGGTTIPANSLTDGQRKLIQALGVDPDSITITPEMVACAEAKLGAARITEIQNGATPSMGEGLSLAACYQ